MTQMSHAKLVRVAHLVVKAEHLASYKAALREEIEASLAQEPGVLTLYASSSTREPTRFTILEVYASQEAYAAHLSTPHFLKYKRSSQDMIESLELVESSPLMPDLKLW